MRGLRSRYLAFAPGDGMIERLLNFLTAMETPAAAPKPDEFELAVAALLIEAARMDEHFDAAER